MDLLEKYIHDNSSPEDALLHELDRQTHLQVINPRMISGHIQGKLLELMVKMYRPKSILEIGTFTGYSALCMAAGLEEGATIDTCEVDDELQPLAQSFFDRSQHGHKINMHIGSALEIAPKLGKQFDMVFIDGDKREYPDYYRMLMDGGLVHSGSILLADNILWYGKVVQPVAHNDRHTEALIEFNRMVVEDDRVESVILPLRDGINIIRVKYETTYIIIEGAPCGTPSFVYVWLELYKIQIHLNTKHLCLQLRLHIVELLNRRQLGLHTEVELNLRLGT